MDYSSCPFCDLTVLSAELERHANGHFEEVEDDELDKQLARDLEFAQQLSLAPTAPPSAMRTEDLERSLREKVGWQKFVKRGVHTLKKPQYQLCYIDPGIASGEEKELLKTMESVFLEF